MNDTEQSALGILKLEVSEATYLEITEQLEARKVNQVNKGVIHLRKGDFLIPPVSYRLAQIRRDVLGEATKMIQKVELNEVEKVIIFCEKLYNWVHTGEQPKSGEWK